MKLNLRKMIKYIAHIILTLLVSTITVLSQILFSTVFDLTKSKKIYIFRLVILGLGLIYLFNWNSITGLTQSQNQSPVAVDDTYSGVAARRVDPPGILENDYDPDGGTPTPVYLTAPAHGTLQEILSGSGGFYYAPNSSYSGTDSFTYKVCDSQNACSSPATVTLNNVNNPPNANSDTYRGLDARRQLNPGFLGNDSDPDGDTIQSVNIVSFPNHGVLDTPLPGYGIGSFTYTPNTGHTGTDVFIYEACDTYGLCSLATVTAK